MSHLVLLLVLGSFSVTCGQSGLAGAEAPWSRLVLCLLADARAEASQPDYSFGDDANFDVPAEAETDQADDPAGEESSDGLVIVPIAIMVDQALHQYQFRSEIPQPSRQHCRCLPLRC